jgi:hypothetical protein
MYYYCCGGFFKRRFIEEALMLKEVRRCGVGRSCKKVEHAGVMRPFPHGA